MKNEPSREGGEKWIMGKRLRQKKNKKAKKKRTQRRQEDITTKNDTIDKKESAYKTTEKMADGRASGRQVTM